ncbi:MAG: hypothetical protein V1773_11285 [bacterium]
MKKFLLIIIFIVFAISTKLTAQVAVIVNKSVSESDITKSKLEEIYKLSATKWKNGDKMVVFDLKSEGATRTNFYNYIGKNPDDLKKIWMRLQLTGEGNAPKSLGSEYEVLEKVASTPGAIGFIGADKISAQVKVILTIK